jgi:hypothetical protein
VTLPSCAPSFFTLPWNWLKRVSAATVGVPPALAAALDDLNDKFGDFTVTRGAFLGLTEADVPDRVGFRKTVTVDDQTGEFRW